MGTGKCWIIRRALGADVAFLSGTASEGDSQAVTAWAASGGYTALTFILTALPSSRQSPRLPSGVGQKADTCGLCRGRGRVPMDELLSTEMREVQEFTL